MCECVCVYQIMAASIFLAAGVNEVTRDPVPHVTCFTDTVALQTHRFTEKHTDLKSHSETEVSVFSFCNVTHFPVKQNMLVMYNYKRDLNHIL